MSDNRHRAIAAAQEAYLNFLALLSDHEAEITLMDLVQTARMQRFEWSSADDRLGCAYGAWHCEYISDQKAKK